MNKLAVKDYQKTATKGQPRTPYTIPTDLHSLLPIPNSNTPWSLLKIYASAPASFLPSHPCMGGQSSTACRSSCTADQGTVKKH